MKTGARNLNAGENPNKNNIDYERAEIVANLLTGDSLEALATRGLHGGRAGSREDKINAVIDYLYKGSYGRDLYTNTPIRGAATDQGHLESNSRGGVRLRPELALINQMLGDSEGVERLQRIDQAARRINAAGSFNEKMLNDPEVQNLLKYKDFQKLVNKQPERAEKYGFTSKFAAERPAYLKFFKCLHHSLPSTTLLRGFYVQPSYSPFIFKNVVPLDEPFSVIPVTIRVPSVV